MQVRLKMTHYEAGRWVDFARGLVTGTDRTEMQAHLDTGCVKCRELACFYWRVAARAAADAGWELPDSVVQQAREIYIRQQPERTCADRRLRRAA